MRVRSILFRHSKHLHKVGTIFTTPLDARHQCDEQIVGCTYRLVKVTRVGETECLEGTGDLDPDLDLGPVGQLLGIELAHHHGVEFLAARLEYRTHLIQHLAVVSHSQRAHQQTDHLGVAQLLHHHVATHHDPRDFTPETSHCHCVTIAPHLTLIDRRRRVATDEIGEHRTIASDPHDGRGVLEVVSIISFVDILRLLCCSFRCRQSSSAECMFSSLLLVMVWKSC
mmetsp:Transcript_7964/g.20078  ORF Transcript_7964/g.20078 Transcript_7964/m.20078 type:complete len:226 (+) Transcript_7964:485-1162(+)